MANEFVARRGIIAQSGGAKITGSLLVSGTVDATGYSVIASSFTGSFSGSIGTATTASYVSPSGLPAGTVSASAQIDYNSIQNKLSGVISSSTQFNALTNTSASYALTASVATEVSGGGQQGYVALWATNSRLSSSGLLYQTASSLILGEGTTFFDETNPDKLGIYAGRTNSFNLISAHANNDNYLQINIRNFSTGSNSSADFVATYDTGTEDTGYINMGINGTSYVGNAINDLPGDGYIYTTGSNLVIGTATSGSTLTLFAGGERYSDGKLRLRANNQHELSGSLFVTGSLTVSGSSTFTNIGPAIFSGSVNTTNGVTGSFTGSFIGDGSNLTGIATILAFSGSTSGTDTLNLKTEALTFSGSNGITATVTNNTVTLAAPAGTVSASSQIDYNNIQNKLSGVVSSSTQVQPLLPTGTVSSSGQVDITATTGYATFSSSLATVDATQQVSINALNAATSSYAINSTIQAQLAGVVSSSAQVKPLLPAGTVSSSAQYPGWVTASSQIDYNSIQNKLSGVYSSSTQVVAAIANQTIAPTTVNATSILSSSVLQTSTNALIGGKLAVTGSAEFTSTVTASNLTANQAVFTNASDGLVSNAITGTGNVVMSASPTLTGTITAQNITATGTMLLAGIFSSSAQVDYNSIQNKLSGVVSSSAQVAPLLPNGTVSSSAQYPGWVTASSQINITATTGYSTFSSSLATVDANQQAEINALKNVTGSYATTGSNTFKADQTITGSLYISQNLYVQGSSSISYISQSTLNIGTNIITVNTNLPGVRLGGLAVIDSASSSPVKSGSFLFDSLNDQWIMVHQDAGNGITSSIALMGPQTYNNVGNETLLTKNRVLKSDGLEHVTDSQITDNGVTVSITNGLSVGTNLTASQADITTVRATTITATGNVSASTSAFINNAIYSGSMVTNIVGPVSNQVVASLLAASCDGVFFDYIVKDGTNSRTGTVMVIENGTAVEFTDVSTNDIGNTAQAIFTVDIVGGLLRLKFTNSSGTWTVKTIIRAL